MNMCADFDPVQFRRPVGSEGRSLLEDMNEHHRPLTDWALSLIPIGKCRKILDIGCGGGMLISLLAKRFGDAAVYGIDFSEESVALSRMTNEDIIREGRCHITLDSVSDLPFAAGTFDLVTAFETYFFWPDTENDIRKASSMVACVGYIAIVSETYPHPDFSERNEEIVRTYNLTLMENDKIKDILSSEGFDVVVNEAAEKNWVAFIGKKVISS